jgi:uncharacterized protein
MRFQIQFRLMYAVAILWYAGAAYANDAALPEGLEVAQNVNARDEGQSVSRSIQFTLTDKRGKTREQQTRAFRQNGDEMKRSVIFYTDPANVAGTALLTYDYYEAGKEDDQWLYLPSMRKVRRVSAANRGDYFLGTDFTYYDMKHELNVEIESYHWQTLDREEVAGHDCFKVEAIPRDPAVAKDLGYSRVLFWIDAENWFKRKADFWDLGGNPLKTVFFRDIREVDGIWTAHELVAQNHKTGHTTVLRMSDIDYEADIDDALFTQVGLKRGP